MKSYTTKAAGLAALHAAILFGCSSEEEDTPPPLESRVIETTCVDADEDGYVVECNGRLDCDDSDPSVTNECYASSCTEQRPGCDCDDEGVRIECELAELVVINGEICGAGEMVCDNGEWGECVLNNSVYKLPEDHPNHQMRGTPNGAER